MKGARYIKFKTSIWKTDIIGAMIIGAVTGLVGFGLFLSMLLLTDRAEPGNEQVDDEDLQPVQSSEESVTMYALQHGVFSSRDAAAQFMSENPILNLATIIPHKQSYYIWSTISPEKYVVSQDIPSFWKEVPLQNKCPQFPELLEDLKNLTENNLTDINEFSKKIPNEWVATLKEVSSLSRDIGVWRVQLLSTDIETSSCIQFNF